MRPTMRWRWECGRVRCLTWLGVGGGLARLTLKIEAGRACRYAACSAALCVLPAGSGPGQGEQHSLICWPDVRHLPSKGWR